MPRSFSNWNAHRRPEASLFAVPSALNARSDLFPPLPEELNVPSDETMSSSLDDLEELVDSLLEDGNPSNLILPYQAGPSQPVGTHPATSREGFIVGHAQGSTTATVPSVQDKHLIGLPPHLHTTTSHAQLHPAHHPDGMAMKPPVPEAEFTWHEREESLTDSDFHGAPIIHTMLPAPNARPWQVQVNISPPLLYWNERRHWMWHKKWALPTLTVNVMHSSGQIPTIGDRLYAFVTAGTLRDDAPGLHDKGLSGECQRMIEFGPDGKAEVSFPRLLFRQTSFNCGNRPFRIVVTILSASGNTMASAATSAAPQSRSPLVPLACICSCPVHVDARKRSKGERPEAKDDDVRLVQRQRPTGSTQTQQQPTGLAGWLGNLTGMGSSPSQPIVPAAVGDAAGDAFVEVRADGVVVQMLSSTAFGYSPAQLLGRTLLTIVHPDDLTGLHQTFAALLAMAKSDAHAHGGSSSQGHRQAPSMRVLHRVIVGLGGSRAPEPVAVDSVVSVASPTSARTNSETLFVCSRYALPIPGAPVHAFSFRVVATYGNTS